MTIVVNKTKERYDADVAQYARQHRMPEYKAKEFVDPVQYVQIINMPSIENANEAALKEMALDIVGHPYFTISIKH